MTENLGRMELKRRRTRQALAASAWELCVAHGLDGFTVDEIAASAGVSPRTFFNYFLTKEDAVLGPILGIGSDGVIECRNRLLARPATETPFCALFEVLTTDWAVGVPELVLRARLVKKHPSLLPRYLTSFALLEGELSAALAERLGVNPRVDFYPHVIVGSALAALRVTADNWSGSPNSKKLLKVLGETYARLDRGSGSTATV